MIRPYYQSPGVSLDACRSSFFSSLESILMKILWSKMLSTSHGYRGMRLNEDIIKAYYSTSLLHQYKAYFSPIIQFFVDMFILWGLVIRGILQHTARNYGFTDVVCIKVAIWGIFFQVFLEIQVSLTNSESYAITFKCHFFNLNHSISREHIQMHPGNGILPGYLPVHIG